VTGEQRLAADTEVTTMRKIVSGLFISLDGVIEDANSWMGPWFNAELGQAVGTMIASQDTMLIGRVTYDEFAAHWPHQEGDMADTMNGTRKYVVSDTLDKADWKNTTVISGDVVAEVTALKKQDGKNIGMTGSATLVDYLLHHGLVDELHLFVLPIVIGSGKRLFRDGDEKLPLKVLSSETYETGVIHVTYTNE
jgi:dihydrofolate reductase